MAAIRTVPRNARLRSAGPHGRTASAFAAATPDDLEPPHPTHQNRTHTGRFRAFGPPESANPFAFAFDLPRLSGTDTTRWPYRRRRSALESVFAARQLSAPWVLCPSTTDPDTVLEWLTWASVGGGRRTLRAAGRRVGAVRQRPAQIQGPRDDRGDRRRGHGSLTAPSSLLLGRYDDDGRLQYTGRTTTLARAASGTVVGLLRLERRTARSVRQRPGRRRQPGRGHRADEPPEGRPEPELLDVAGPVRHLPLPRRLDRDQAPLGPDRADQSEIDTINVYAGGPCQMTVVHYIPAP
jgi:hypothetical protein